MLTGEGLAGGALGGGGRRHELGLRGLAGVAGETVRHPLSRGGDHSRASATAVSAIPPRSA